MPSGDTPAAPELKAILNAAGTMARRSLCERRNCRKSWAELCRPASLYLWPRLATSSMNNGSGHSSARTAVGFPRAVRDVCYTTGTTGAIITKGRLRAIGHSIDGTTARELYRRV